MWITRSLQKLTDVQVDIQLSRGVNDWALVLARLTG